MPGIYFLWGKSYTFNLKRGLGNSGMPGDSTPPCWVWAACPECRRLIWLQATDKNDKKDKKRHRHAAIPTLTGSRLEKIDWPSTYIPIGRLRRPGGSLCDHRPHLRLLWHLPHRARPEEHRPKQEVQVLQGRHLCPCCCPWVILHWIVIEKSFCSVSS